MFTLSNGVISLSNNQLKLNDVAKEKFVNCVIVYGLDAALLLLHKGIRHEENKRENKTVNIVLM